MTAVPAAIRCRVCSGDRLGNAEMTISAADLMLAELHPFAIRTSVYVALDSGGTPLYVGITGKGAQRFAQHAAENAHWWLEVDRLIIRHFACRHDALNVEAFLIQRLHSEWNVHRPLRDQRRGQALAVQHGFDCEFEGVCLNVPRASDLARG